MALPVHADRLQSGVELPGVLLVDDGRVLLHYHREVVWVDLHFIGGVSTSEYMLVLRSDGLCYDSSYTYLQIHNSEKYTYVEIQMMG